MMLVREHEEVLNRILHGIGHDLRNGLNALHVNNYLLLEAGLASADRDVVLRNATTIRDLRDLVDLTVRVSDLRSGALRFMPQAEDAAGVLTTAAESARRAVGCTLSVRMPQAGESWTINADAVLVAWVLRSVVRSGFDPAPPAQGVVFALEPRDGEVALCVSSSALRMPIRDDPLRDEAAWQRAVPRADLELAAAAEVTQAMGARLVREPDRDPPAWTLVFRTEAGTPT